jgi:hypothetical protein
MKEEAKPDRGQINSQSKKHPLEPREYPLARDARGSAVREEIRSKTRMVTAPRQSNRPMQQGNRNQTHGR